MKIHIGQLDMQISPEVAEEYIEYRQSMEKKYKLKTQGAFDRQMREALKAAEVGMAPDELIEFTMDQNWVGINISYTKKRLAQMQEAESYGSHRQNRRETPAESAISQAQKAHAIAERAANQASVGSVGENGSVVPLKMEISRG